MPTTLAASNSSSQAASMVLASEVRPQVARPHVQLFHMLMVLSAHSAFMLVPLVSKSVGWCLQPGAVAWQAGAL
jgi:hypothetical protein